jgi:diguanylate cyclase (GGDEF)-like protein/PAS domain S-box-containing protein
MESMEPHHSGIDYRALLDSSPDVQTVATADGIYLHVAPASEGLLGWAPADLESRSCDDFVHPDDRSVGSLGRAAWDGRTTTSTLRFLRRDGSYVWVEAKCRKVQVGGDAFVVSALRDVSERHHDAGLRRLALTDPLTGIANRAVLMDSLQQALHRQTRGEGILAVLYADLDRLKAINDSLGHRAGDVVLTQVAERLVGQVRLTDTLARFGGDEFVIVAEGVTSERAAIELAERIVETGREPFRLGDDEVTCTLSVGIACNGTVPRSGVDLLHEADLALYRAKELGRDRVEVFDEGLRTEATGRMLTGQLLRRAFEERHIVVDYEPIFDLATRRAVGAEALIGIDELPPDALQRDSYLEAADGTWLLYGLQNLALTDAVRRAAAWQGHVGGTETAQVAVNVTGRHLADARFASSITEALEREELAPHALLIEIPGPVLADASSAALAGLRGLRARGVQIGMDHFGAGYSALNSIRQFPLDFVKIDRNLVCGLEHDDEQQAMIAAIVLVARALNLTVTAEGVESDGVARLLHSLGCQRGQGPFLAPPGHADSLRELWAPQTG